MGKRPVHGVHYVTGDDGDGLKSVPAFVFGGFDEGETLPVVYAIVDGQIKEYRGADGKGVPHGSASQGVTWY